MELIPLNQWVCDSCRQIIKSPENGWLEWLQDENQKPYGFKIVHNAISSPRKPKGDCYHYNDKIQRADDHLESFLGENGLPYMLCFLDKGQLHDKNFSGPWVRDIREFVEIIRRLFTPFYEEARLYWGDAISDGIFEGANEVSPYLPKTLEKIVEKYRK